MGMVLLMGTGLCGLTLFSALAQSRLFDQHLVKLSVGRVFCRQQDGQCETNMKPIRDGGAVCPKCATELLSMTLLFSYQSGGDIVVVAIRHRPKRGDKPDSVDITPDFSW